VYIAFFIFLLAVLYITFFSSFSFLADKKKQIKQKNLFSLFFGEHSTCLPVAFSGQHILLMYMAKGAQAS